MVCLAPALNPDSVMIMGAGVSQLPDPVPGNALICGAPPLTLTLK